MKWLKDFFNGKHAAERQERLANERRQHIALLRATLEATTALIEKKGWQSYREMNSSFNGAPLPHQRAWYGLLQSGTRIDVSGGVFDHLVVDVSLKSVRAANSSFAHCLFLKAFLSEANLDGAIFTDAIFQDALKINRSSLRRTDFTNAYLASHDYYGNDVFLTDAILSGLRLGGTGWNSFLERLTDAQRKAVRLVPSIDGTATWASIGRTSVQGKGEGDLQETVSLYKRFLNSKVVNDLVSTAGEIQACLARHDSASIQMMDLLKPKVEMPQTGPTGRPLLDLTGGRPDTPQWIGFMLLTDQANPNYGEYLDWVRRSSDAFDRAWIRSILGHVSTTSDVESVHQHCSELCQQL